MTQQNRPPTGLPERRQPAYSEETEGRALTTSAPVSFIRAGLAFIAAYGSLTIAINWSAFWTLVFAVDIVDFDNTIQMFTEAGGINWSQIPSVAIALVAVITLAPALLVSYAGMPSTPIIIAKGAFWLSVAMSLYDILSTVLGFDIVNKIKVEFAVNESVASGVLTSVGVLMTSVLASFADEAAIVFASLGFAFLYEGWRRYKGEELTIISTRTTTPIISGLERLFGRDNGDGDGR